MLRLGEAGEGLWHGHLRQRAAARASDALLARRIACPSLYRYLTKMAEVDALEHSVSACRPPNAACVKTGDVVSPGAGGGESVTAAAQEFHCTAGHEPQQPLVTMALGTACPAPLLAAGM